MREWIIYGLVAAYAVSPLLFVGWMEWRTRGQDWGRPP